jgi:hypothetical protein
LEQSSSQRLSEWVFSECRLTRRFLSSGPYVFKMYGVRVGEILVDVQGEASTADGAIWAALSSLDDVRKNMETADTQEGPSDPSGRENS